MKDLLIIFGILFIASGACSAISSSDYMRVKEQINTTQQQTKASTSKTTSEKANQYNKQTQSSKQEYKSKSKIYK